MYISYVANCDWKKLYKKKKKSVHVRLIGNQLHSLPYMIIVNIGMELVVVLESFYFSSKLES